MAETVVSYTDWLTSLKEGDAVCLCKNKRIVVGVTRDTLVIPTGDDGCVESFCRFTGRKMGSRKGSYREGTVGPWTQEMQEKLDEKVRLENAKLANQQKLNEKEDVIGNIIVALTNKRNTYCPDVRRALNKLPVSMLSDMSVKLTSIKQDSMKYSFEEWETEVCDD